MSRNAEIHDRLAEIGEETQKLLERQVGLEMERTRLLGELKQLPVVSPTPPAETSADPADTTSKGSKGDVPLPLGRAVSASKIAELKAEIAAMTDFDRDARPFIKKWGAELSHACWMELSSALQIKFAKRRQQIAGVLAALNRKNGEEHVAAQS